MVSTSIPTLSIAAISSAKAKTQYYNTKHGKIATDRGVALLNGPTQPPRDILSHLLACWTGVLTYALSRAGGESVCKGTDKTHLVGALVSKCLLGPLDPVFDVDHDSVSDLKSGRFL